MTDPSTTRSASVTSLIGRRDALYAVALWALIVAAALTAGWLASLVGGAQERPAPTPAQVATRPGSAQAVLAGPSATVATTGTAATVTRPTDAATVTPYASPPAAHQVLLRVTGQPQERSLSCEFRSAADLAAFYGVDLSWEEVFIAVGTDLGGDPSRGFVGASIDDPAGGLYPAGYGVYAEPLARGLRTLNLAATAHVGMNAVWLRAQLDAGHPVIVWSTYDMRPQVRVSWQTREGATIWGVRYEHTYTAFGYDAGGIWVIEPLDASRKHYTWSVFDVAWDLLGRMALTIDE